MSSGPTGPGYPPSLAEVERVLGGCRRAGGGHPDFRRAAGAAVGAGVLSVAGRAVSDSVTAVIPEETGNTVAELGRAPGGTGAGRPGTVSRRGWAELGGQITVGLRRRPAVAGRRLEGRHALHERPLPGDRPSRSTWTSWPSPPTAARRGPPGVVRIVKDPRLRARRAAMSSSSRTSSTAV